MQYAGRGGGRQHRATVMLQPAADGVIAIGVTTLWSGGIGFERKYRYDLISRLSASAQTWSRRPFCPSFSMTPAHRNVSFRCLACCLTQDLVSVLLQVEATLEQLLLLAASGEEYSQWVLSRMSRACEPAPLPATRHNAFRQDRASNQE